MATNMPIPKQRRGLLKTYDAICSSAQKFFFDLPHLIQSDFKLTIAVSYAFFRIEEGQRMVLYLGATKLHRTNSKLTWTAIDSYDLKRAEFKKMFRSIYGFDISKDADKYLIAAQETRDSLMHGKKPVLGKQVEAIAYAMGYVQEMNQLIASKKRFMPFDGDLRGVSGRRRAFDMSTSRWILKGMGFELK